MERAGPVAYWDAAQMQRYYRLSYELLWKCVVADKTLPMPAVWVDDQPGWERPCPDASLLG
ncbi:hypothetical protein B0T36_14680 [Nocardia donostiensis]|nr:hypothetical protein B0T36_14680 [Nocardia donostiensis]